MLRFVLAASVALIGFVSSGDASSATSATASSLLLYRVAPYSNSRRVTGLSDLHRKNKPFGAGKHLDFRAVEQCSVSRLRICIYA
jgi:hypothetical protein